MMGITFRLCVCVLACSFIGSAAAHAVVSTFEVDEEGWTVTGDINAFGQEDTGGNPDGYLRVVDSASGPIIYLHAPSKFLGNKSSYDGQTLSFDYQVISQEGPDYLSEFGEVTLFGNSTSVTRDLGSVPPVGQWTHFSIPMTAAAWGMTSGDWSALLGDLTGVEFRAEAIDGDETFGMDNFQITPEPASAALLAIGSLLLTRRRR